MKAVIDTGTMITLSSTCLMNVFREFVKYNHIELLVSSSVAEESVWRPLSNKRFALNAARIKYAFNTKIVNVIPTSSEIQSEQQKILTLANEIYSTEKGGQLKIIQAGEAEALAIARIHNAHALFIDERTTRSLIENPARLRNVLERRQDEKIMVDEEKLIEFKEMFPQLKMFRSVDLIAMAYEQDLFNHELEHGKLELEAALYSAKFAGCAVSENEIDNYIKTIHSK
ncbi:MAG: hypothetical protein AABW59_01570 [archaeon]